MEGRVVMPRAMLPAIRIAAICIAAICIAAICINKIAAGAAWADTLVPNMNPFAVGPPPAGGTSTSTPPGTASPFSALTGRDADGPRCTIAVITENAGTSDTYLFRMTVPAADAPVGAAPFCPPGATETATQLALDACKLHAASREDCVFADTDHMFDISTDVVDSSALNSQCFSYTSKFIGIACRPGTQQDNCSIACGATAAAATAAARTRCHANHDGDCTRLNAVPVQAP
jgi:hypothetical protein